MRIKNITLGIPQKICSHLSIRPIIDDLDATSCNTYVQVFDRVVTNIPAVLDENGIEITPAETQVTKTVEWSGNVPINEEQYKLCKNNSTLMEDYVIAYLGLVRR